MHGQTPRARRARLALAITALIGGTAAQAQDTPPAAPADATTTLEAVSVTGTRLKSQTMTAASPVMEIDAERFKQSGATRVEDLVNQFPQMTANFDSFQNNGATGYGTVSLRDLGASRTLTLFNGRRLPIGTDETTDLSIIPSYLLKRVDVLTGGASAVYGSDAVAGVVNFMLDDEFEGVAANIGYSAYQHDNDNDYMRKLAGQSGYASPQGNSGFGGIARDLDLAVGGKFGENGHAIGWLGWRKNEALMQGDRDYSACALNASGTGCGGSATADPPNFLVTDDSGRARYAHLLPDGRWAPGQAGLYNYAPANFYQRPDERFNGGFSLKYEINPQFRPYLEGQFVNHQSTSQLAPSGTFFGDDLSMACTDPLLGSLCSDLGVAGSDVAVSVGKRNVEGGARVTDTDTNSFRLVVGSNGDLNERWSYDAYFLYARNNSTETARNDFLKDRVVDALRGCPAGAFKGCVPYNVWVPNGVTPAAAAALAGTSLREWDTTLKVLSAYASGDTGWSLPWAAEDAFKLVVGMEWRDQRYGTTSDNDTRTGNFSGAGGPRPDVSGAYNVTEAFLEGGLPIIAHAGALDRLNADLGVRYSDYSTSGGVGTYKVGLTADLFEDRLHLRGGWNRAIRGPSVSALYRPQTIALWNGSDPCAGSTPEFTPAQCARTGVSAAQYGTVLESPAGQYNMLYGGSRELAPETADTWTFGAAFTPIPRLDLSVDYYDIEVRNAITDIGASTILRSCGQNGIAALCDRVHRNRSTGDLWVGDDRVDSGYVTNVYDNFGNFYYRGIDLSARYRWTVGPGSLVTDLVGSYTLEQKNEPIPGVASASYDCAGVINESCNSPQWRHVANARYSWDNYSVGVRWRYVGEVDYTNTDGTAGTTDKLVAQAGGIDAANYFDLSGSMRFADAWEWTLGVNNLFDRAPPLVGSTLVGAYGNANSPSGYDPAGRYLFTSLSYRY